MPVFNDSGITTHLPLRINPWTLPYYLEISGMFACLKVFDLWPAFDDIISELL